MCVVVTVVFNDIIDDSVELAADDACCIRPANKDIGFAARSINSEIFSHCSFIIIKYSIVVLVLFACSVTKSLIFS